MGKKKTEKAAKPAKAPPPPKAPKPPKEAAKPGVLPTGKLAIRKDPRFFASEVVGVRPAHKRVVGLDMGTNCGFAYCDIMPGVVIKTAPVVMGQFDLSLGPYDSSAIRFIRLQQFLAVLRPDLVTFEDVKFTGTNEIADAGGSVTAIIARAATSIEFFGGLKAALVSWCELYGIPCEGVGISAIKAFATGKGNASKEQMILAANKWFGVDLAVDGYERTGADNIADASFVCAMGVSSYSEGLTGESKWVGTTGGPPAGSANYRAAVAEPGSGVGEPASGDGVSASGSEDLASVDLRHDSDAEPALRADEAAESAG